VSVYTDRSENGLNQGDIFADVPFEQGPITGLQLGMVVSHDCDCDKFLKPSTSLSDEERDRWTITLAVVHPVDLLTEGRPKAVRADEMPRYLYLQAEDDHPEMCVDLWTEQPVRALTVLDCELVASLSTETRNQLWWKIIRLRLGKHFRSILQGEIPPDAA
jgi:hypothetical protein